MLNDLKDCELDEDIAIKLKPGNVIPIEFRSLNILSIDWDYFFPNNFDFDWAMDESRFLFYEMIWPIRWGNIHLMTKELAKDIYHPDQQLLNGFLDKILINSNPSLLSIADSHTDIKHLINLFSAKVNIYNFDQHHDIYYGNELPNKESEPNCGNWVGYFLDRIESYHLYYPPWRKSNLEHTGKLLHTNSVSFTIPKNPPSFQMIFICRSSPWTPSWSDHHWIKFIEYFKTNYRYTWDHKLALDYALKPRPFDLKQAKQYYEQTKKMMQQYKNQLNEKEK